MSLATPAIVALTARGADLGRQLKALLVDAELYGLAGRVEDPDRVFVETVAHLRRLYQAGRPIIGICASGILVRALGSVLTDKQTEPPVLAVAEDGSVVVPLLGGHRGGNRLARRLAAHLDAVAAITTASDTRYGVALDAPPPGWALANPGDHKAFAASALAGRRVTVVGTAAWLEGLREGPREGEGPVTDAGRPPVPAATGAPDLAAPLPLRITVTPRRVAGDAGHLIYHPATLAVGVGCERDTPPEALVALVETTLAEADLAPAAVAGVFSLDLKADEPAVLAVGARLGVPVRFFDAAHLESLTPRLATPSEVVFAEVGCHGVAEAAALAAAGTDGTLVVAKRKSRRATCAVAMAAMPIAAKTVGRARGRLSVVGIGPGAARLRVPAAEAAITGAEHVVGYRLYLDLVAELLGAGQTVHGYGLGEETQRVQDALALAAGGAAVALVCSGDAGIYAMASLVYEQLELTADPAWRRIAVEVIPGISALQAAAALAGAPIGHDFCAVSLSDLLTPRSVIEQRLTAAGEGDFVIALYNPISTQRRATFEAAMAIIRRHRGPDTVVVLGRNLGRAGESVEVLPLAELVAERVDMLTVVLIGSSATRALRIAGETRVYTPRGYADKAPPPTQESSG